MDEARFEPVPESALAARRFVRAQLGDRLDVDVALVVLLADELVTNAIRHTRRPFGVRVTSTVTGVVIIVEDQLGAPLPDPTWPEAGAGGGRGLAIVASAADRWGTEPTSNGKRVWFGVEARSPEA